MQAAADAPPAPRSGGVRRPAPPRGPARLPGEGGGRAGRGRRGDGLREASTRPPCAEGSPTCQARCSGPAGPTVPAQRPALGSPAFQRTSNVTSAADTLRHKTQPRGSRRAPSPLAGLDQSGRKDAEGARIPLTSTGPRRAAAPLPEAGLPAARLCIHLWASTGGCCFCFVSLVFYFYFGSAY